MPPELAEVRRWLVKSDPDRCAVEDAMERDPPMTDVGAFHCQQAVDKVLKAYLVWREHEFENVHDLRVLSTLCVQHDPGFLGLRDRVAALTPYAVRFRNPGPADPTVEPVHSAPTIVGEVWGFVLDRLPPEVRP